MTESNLKYTGGILHLDGCSLRKLAQEYGTPLYVYSADRIKSNYKSYDDAFRNTDKIICYSVKANFNGAVIKLLASLGAGADVLSEGELFMALRAGIDPKKIVFAGVGKNASEIRQAVRNGICMLNIEGEQELEAVGEIVKQEKKTLNIAFRINPDIDPKTHPKIATGLKESKFGIPIRRALEVYKRAKGMENIRIAGVHLHIGSQITDTLPFKLAAESAVGFADRLAEEGIEVEYIDIGGGLGIGYENDDVSSPYDFAKVLESYFRGRPQKLILEPGRSIVGNAGYLLTRVNYIKQGANKNFVVVDAGFNDLIRPAMYGAYHNIMPVEESDETITADVVGPICETGDVIAKDRGIRGAKQGNILAICDSGAYGFSMSSNYNSRLRAAEVLLEGGKPRLVRRRETYEDLIRTEETR